MDSESQSPPVSPKEDRQRGASFLAAGGGQMGALMRRTDWSATPLGPVSGWPQSLRIAVQIVLNSRYPMFVWWGRELINLYNDGYVPMLGDRHPVALGQPAARVWAEIWDTVGVQAEAVLNEGRSSWNEELLLVIERKGYREEAFFTFSYSPVPDDQGGIGGVYCAVMEETQRVIGQRRVKALQELAARITAEADSERRACESVIGALAEHRRDVSFALLYLLDTENRAVRLACATGLSRESRAAPVQLELDSLAAPGWPFRAVLESGRAEVVTDLDQRFGDLPGGAWPEPTRTAIVLPLSNTAQGTLAGFLVAGVSPRRELDDAYRSFFDLLASHIATAIIRGRASDEERGRTEALAELDRAKTEFFSNVSHEFRTPLTLMLGPLDDALSAIDDEEQRERLEVAQRNALRLQKLVNTLLDFSRIEAGRIEACYEATELGRLTTELASSFRSACDKAGIELVIDCPAPAELVHVDRDMWEKIVLNLVSNAFKFTHKGQILVSLRAAGDRVVLQVRDTGTGIPRDQLPRLFERFHRVAGAAGRTQEGSGIGLAMVRELVRLHGGAVEVQSQPGEGSTFTVTVPRGKSHLPADRIHAPGHKASTALGAAPYVQEALRWLPSDSGPPAGEYARGAARADEACILVVDDNADMRDYLVRLLRGRYRVEAVGDGEMALDVVRGRPPDLVLTDVMMPRLDGFGLLRAIRSDARIQALPVILLSARAGEEARIEGLDAGADDYLVKPFGARELMARVGGVVALTRERKWAAEALHRSDERYRRYFSLGLIGMAVTSPTKGCLEVNDQLCRMLGYSRDELLGMSWTALTHPDDLAADEAQFERVMRGEIDGYTLDKRWIMKDGSIIDSTISVACLRAPDGSVDHFVGLVQDITERKRAEAALREADRAKSDFLAALSHELRNPMAPIKNSLAILERAAPGSETSHRAQAVIGRQFAQLTRLVDDLLDVTRISRNKLELQRERFELGELISRTVEDYRPQFDANGIRLELRAAVGELFVNADRNRVAQAVGNLLQNAVKFAGRGGLTTVTVTSENERGGRAVVRVADNGVGVAPEVLARLFQPFVQAEDNLARSKGGLGLGLALVKAIIEHHGGEISAHSEGLGRGMEMVFRLPLANAGEAPSSGRQLRPALSNRRVLIIEDNPDAASSLRDLLEVLWSQCEVAVAHTGQDGLRLAHSFHPDLVLCDIGLPELDGYEVARAFRADDELRSARLVALSGYAQPEDLRNAAAAGFEWHLAKPLALEKLNDILHVIDAA